MTNKEFEEMKKVLRMALVTEQDHIDLDVAHDDVVNEVERRTRSMLNRMLAGLPNEVKNDIIHQALHAIYWSPKW